MTMKNKSLDNQIHSNIELFQAIYEATEGRISRVYETENPMTLILKEDYCVTIYEDNHEILVEISRGNERIARHYRSYDKVFYAVLAMESKPYYKQKKKVEAVAGNKKCSFKKLFFLIFGMIFTVFGGALFLICLAGAISDKFQPVYVYLSLLFSFGVMLMAGISAVCMGIKIGRKIKTEDEETEENRNTAKMTDKKTAKKLLDELKKRTERDALRIIIDEERKPTFTGSKLGGTPYWDDLQEYPTASDGRGLILLAQFNLAELPENNLFPKHGILQFFILDDMYYGMPFYEHGYPKNTFRVVYHSEINENITEENVLSYGIITSRDFSNPLNENTYKQGRKFPVIGEYAVSFKNVKVHMNDNDVRCMDLLYKIAAEMDIEADRRLDAQKLFGILNDGDKKYSDFHEATCGHYLCGYPDFRQWDPRSLSSAEYYDTMLFQLDSDSYFGEWRVLWGDAGVGSFFINSEKLSDMEFDDVLYNWDCC